MEKPRPRARGGMARLSTAVMPGVSTPSTLEARMLSTIAVGRLGA